VTLTIDLVARPEARRVLADRLDHPREVEPDDVVLLGLGEPDVEADGEGEAPHPEVVAGGE
jgi:hypothetical protein